MPHTNYSGYMPEGDQLRIGDTITSSPGGFCVVTFTGSSLVVSFGGDETNIVGGLVGATWCRLTNNALVINSDPNWIVTAPGPIIGIEALDNGEVAIFNLGGIAVVLFSAPTRAIEAEVRGVQDAIQVLGDKFDRLKRSLPIGRPGGDPGDGRYERIVLESGFPEAIGDIEEKTGS